MDDIVAAWTDQGWCDACKTNIKAHPHKPGCPIAEIERLRAALGPFAVASDSYDDEPPARVIASKRGSILSVCDLRIAKAALG